MSDLHQDASGQVCVLCHVAGHVQGVFFRASTREQAKNLGLTGHARNLPDGRVEVLACGPAEAVDALRAWLSRGPANARVTGVACEPMAYRPLTGFVTG
ncbi:acylphosphatase [Thiohalocapsa marina]|uniref:acylphosphatase n=1 Tax=Thiohalocapsa marina TaxID=424902 RepID=A0A5M8FRU3_9GAMM|nr:acylphosphatase [Thiohalocapsa marina]KAA6185775.1 acylphosphatase [Thiohalocapsa marina]